VSARIIRFDLAGHSAIGEQGHIVTAGAGLACFVSDLVSQGRNGEPVHRIVEAGKGVRASLLLREHIRVTGSAALDIGQIGAIDWPTLGKLGPGGSPVPFRGQESRRHDDVIRW
jgi:hypothetical protein